MGSILLGSPANPNLTWPQALASPFMSLLRTPPPQAIIFVCIFYPMLGFASSAAHFFYFLAMTLLSLMFYVAYGQVGRWG